MGQTNVGRSKDLHQNAREEHKGKLPESEVSRMPGLPSETTQEGTQTYSPRTEIYIPDLGNRIRATG